MLKERNDTPFTKHLELTGTEHFYTATVRNIIENYFTNVDEYQIIHQYNWNNWHYFVLIVYWDCIYS